MSVHFSVSALVSLDEHGDAADIEATWSRLVASLERAARAAASIGAARYVVRADGLDYFIVDGVVITVQASPRR